MTYSGDETFTPTPLSRAQRAQLPSTVEERRRSLGSEQYQTDEIVIRTGALFAEAHWTCESLQTVADSLYTDAALAPDQVHFEIYYTLAGWYQDAHDAQCGTAEPFPF